MSRTHGPDFDALRREPIALHASARSRDAFWWPDINQEDLVKPRILPLFLKSRARNSPCAFWKFDLDACHVAYAVGAIDEPYLNRHAMIFREQYNPETYGRLVSWTNEESAIDVLKKYQSLPPGGGLTTLEIPQRLMRLLVQCFYETIHDIPAPETLSGATLPEPPIMPNVNDFAFLAALRSEAPYKVPEGMDIPRLRTVLSAKRSAAEDHSWALREDPSYFTEILVEAKNHRYELVRDVHGLSHANTQKVGEHLLGPCHQLDGRKCGLLFGDLVPSLQDPDRHRAETRREWWGYTY